MQTPNLKKSKGALARSRDANAVVDHLRANAVAAKSGYARREALHFPHVPVIIGDLLTDITTNPNSISVYQCETQFPDHTYPPNLQNTAHVNQIVGELWDYRLLPLKPTITSKLLKNSVYTAMLWGYNDDAKRYVFVLSDFPSGTQQCRVVGNGTDSSGPTYDVYAFEDTGHVTKLNTAGAVAPKNYRDTNINYTAGSFGVFWYANSGAVNIFVFNEAEASTVCASTPSVAGSSLWSPTPINIADYTASIGDKVNCDPSSAGFTVTLPPIAGNNGTGIWVKNITTSTNTITVAADGSETIDGNSTVSIASAYGGAVFVVDEIIGEWSIE